MKNWLNNKSITKNIDGEDIEFHRIPVGVLQKFKDLSDPVAKALAMVFSGKENDVEVQTTTSPSDVKNEEGEVLFSSRTVKQAAHSSIISMRKIQKEEGIKSLLSVIFSDASMEVLSEIIVRSACKEFVEEDIPKIKENMDIGTMVQFLMGAFEASAGDYAKLGESLFQNSKAKELLEKVTKAM